VLGVKLRYFRHSKKLVGAGPVPGTGAVEGSFTSPSGEAWGHRIEILHSQYWQTSDPRCPSRLKGAAVSHPVPRHGAWATPRPHDFGGGGV
jgi:hypothetical protein